MTRIEFESSSSSEPHLELEGPGLNFSCGSMKKNAEIRDEVAIDRRALLLHEWVGPGPSPSCHINTNIQLSTKYKG